MAFKPDPGAAILFMKVGTHAKEDLPSIIARKRKELEAAGVSFWGYGGACHPATTVQPFVAEATEHGQNVYLCMQEINSRHFAEQKRAEEYSADGGQTWLPVPEKVNVLGSRYALVIDSLDPTDFTLDLSATSVGVGLQRGRAGSDYVRGRVDKACLRLVAPNAPARIGTHPLQISLAARLADPYAVLLR